jgi:hypothetical protein
VDRHLEKLGHDLDLLDKTNPDYQEPREITSILDTKKKSCKKLCLLGLKDYYAYSLLVVDGMEKASTSASTTVEEEDDDDNEEDEDDEEAYFAAMMANRQKKRKKKEARDGEEHAEEPLYCYCRQVSYGEMVGCDGEVRSGDRKGKHGGVTHQSSLLYT